MKDICRELREDFSGAEIKMKIEKKVSEEKRKRKKGRKRMVNGALFRQVCS